jgi:hypothetical protein
MRPRSSLLACAVLLLAACSAGDGSHVKSSGSAGRSNSRVVGGGHLIVFAVVQKAKVQATTAVLGRSSAQIGRVTEIDAVNRYAERIWIVLDVPTTLHTDATAIVCQNLVRINPGRPSMPINPDFIITLAHSFTAPGPC